MSEPEALDGKIPLERRVYCNRTLNMRAIRAVGYDMDYTLIHYRPEEWERHAYEHMRQRLLEQGWPVDALCFDPDLVVRGLVIDGQLGNVLKANRFGFVRRSYHGTRPLTFDEQRATYARTVVDLSESRYGFLNTLFSLSEACLFAQLVDMLDERRLPEVLGYEDLYRRVRTLVDRAHMEGALKADIMADPDRFVVLDPEVPTTLIDQREAGKKLMLVTNSEWSYTTSMMSYAFDRFLPAGAGWRSLFDVVIVGAGKPAFFTDHSPIFEVVSDDGLLRPSTSGLREGGAYFGGSAPLVEAHLGLSGDEILYIGDHIYGDVHVVKNVLRWRTGLIARELEDEIAASVAHLPQEGALAGLMAEKERLERAQCRIRLELQRRKSSRSRASAGDPAHAALTKELAELRTAHAEIDSRIAPLAKTLAEQSNVHWGPLMRAGNDKSHYARQVERHADVYTSRVSNFMLETPFAFLRSPRTSLPHDPAPSFPDSD